MVKKINLAASKKYFQNHKLGIESQCLSEQEHSGLLLRLQNERTKNISWYKASLHKENVFKN